MVSELHQMMNYLRKFKFNFYVKVNNFRSNFTRHPIEVSKCLLPTKKTEG